MLKPGGESRHGAWLADWIEAGAEVNYNDPLDEFDANGRSATIETKYQVFDQRGTEIYRNNTLFENEAGQKFERVSRREIFEKMGR